jgi:cell wall assembly regulator SMI1
MMMNKLRIVSQTNKPTTIKKIKSFEKRLNSRLPNDFKQFLLKYQGKINLDINHVIVDFGNNFIDKVAVFSLSDIDEVIQSWNHIKNYEDCKNILAIGDTLGDGRFFCNFVKFKRL